VPSEPNPAQIPVVPGAETGQLDPLSIERDVTTRPADRLSVRFGASLLSNIARLGLGMLSGLLVARGLGAVQYGDYQFLLASVASLAQFIDLGTSQAFYTFISRQRRCRRFLIFYAAWLAAQFVAVVAAVGVMAPQRLIDALWLGHDRGTLLLAFIATFLMNELWEAVGQLGEAQRRTIVVQGALGLQAAAHLVLIAVTVSTSHLTVPIVFVFVALEYSVLIALLGPRFVRANLRGTGGDETLASVASEFYRYCKPLFVYALCGFVLLFADRWLLQRFGGARQQGFFAIGQQFSTVSLIATTAVLQVFWKEIAAATAAGDHARSLALYRSTSRALYFVAAWMSCLLIPYSREILSLTVGQDFLAAGAPFAIMLLYPLHQSMGRIGTSFLHATGETGLYSRVGIGAMLVSLPLAYVLLAPRTAALPGLALGAIGLSLKAVLANVISVNLQARAIALRFGTVIDWRHQIGVLVFLLGVAFACRTGVRTVLTGAGSGYDLVAALAGATIYAVVSAVVLVRYPAVIGLTAAQVRAIAATYRALFRGRGPIF
jgi:O-antigen/teichoic acid export membrane protein